MIRYQSTLRDAIVIEGVGLHTGVPCRVEMRPAPPDTGLLFRLDGGTRFPATAEYVVETARATVLGYDGSTVSTVEHLLAALFGMGVSNAYLDVSGPEIPVADGSAKTFADAIAQTGIASQREPRERFTIAEPTFVRDGDRAIVILPASKFRVKFVADFAPPVGTQYFDSEITPEIFHREVAAARTFGYLHEVEALRRRGLARGGTMENAVVFDAAGPMQPLRWPNEIVRHKVLDLLGDFALLGAFPQFEVIAIKSGHKLHCIATRELRKRIGSALLSTKVR